jgi:hypothetical protein
MLFLLLGGFCGEHEKARHRDVPRCGAEISRIPLTEEESFTFSYDKKRGVELDFATAR